ncbi:MAG: TonB-dependent copper receptor [Elusimicrobiota bacterium]|jgi:iron complex outermembrane receptor protein|nr:TonB-dependent copper receptor [Elusimicrobiota bacterium]
MKTKISNWTFAAYIITFAFFLKSNLYADNIITLDNVIVIATPLSSPLEIKLNTKQSRQPVPSNDGTDYLKTVPGFTAMRSGGANSDVVFRGSFGSRINIVTDGGNIFGGCANRMDSPGSYIAPELYDSVRIIKGPQTTLYGGGTSGATIIFERENLGFANKNKSYEIKTDIIAGSFNRIGANIDASAGTEKIYFRFFGNNDRSGDYKDGNGNIVPSKWEKWNSDAELGWTPDENTILKIGGGIGGGYARYGGRAMDGSKFKRESANVKFERKNIADVLDKIEFVSYYNYANHIMDNFTLRTPPNSGMMAGGSWSNPSRTVYGGRTAATFNFNKIFNLTGGIDAQIDSHKNRTKAKPSFTKDLQFNKYGVFAELTSSINEKNKIISGVRFDANEAEDFRDDSYTKNDDRKNLLPGGFLRFEQNIDEKDLIWYAGIGHSQRFPDYWELVQNNTIITGKNAFQYLEPEKTTQLDIGAQYKINKFNLWLSAYAGMVEDFILFNYSTSMGMESKSVQNINAQIYGSEFGINYEITQEVKAKTSLSYSYGKNESDNNPLPQIPPLEGKISLIYDTEKWQTGLIWRLTAKQDRVSINQGNVVGKDFSESDAFNILSANVSVLLREHIKLSIGIDNIFDTAYYEHLNLAGNSNWGFSANEKIYEPGRIFWLKLNVDF